MTESENVFGRLRKLEIVGRGRLQRQLPPPTYIPDVAKVRPAALRLIFAALGPLIILKNVT